MQIRQHLRELQWRLPLRVQSVLLAVGSQQLNPYSDWSRDRRAIFIHVPRTGGTSIAQALGAPKPHIPIARYAAIDRAACSSFFKFAVVRNPWDRLLSAFSTLKIEPTKVSNWTDGKLWAQTHLTHYRDFEHFVLDLLKPEVRQDIMRYFHFRPQIDWLVLPRSTDVCMDFIGRFERLEEAYAHIAERVGTDVPLPRANASEHKPYQEAYSNRMRDIVADLYRADIETFGYQF